MKKWPLEPGLFRTAEFHHLPQHEVGRDTAGNFQNIAYTWTDLQLPSLYSCNGAVYEHTHIHTFFALHFLDKLAPEQRRLGARRS